VVDERAAGRTYNVGPERTPTVAEWTRAVGDVLGWAGRIVLVDDGTLDESLGGAAGTDPRHGVDLVSARIRAELGVHDPVDLATAVRRSAEWERAHRGAGPTADDYAREDAILAAQ
jgi:nucleoside-diphosphate-sugar epimerase